MRNKLKILISSILAISIIATMVGFFPTATLAQEKVKQKDSIHLLEENIGSSEWDNNEGVSIKYRWNSFGFNEIILPNGKSIVTDPYYYGIDNPYILDKTKTAADVVEGADYVLFTHNHFDHSGDFPYLLEKFHEAAYILPALGAPSFCYAYNVSPISFNIQPVSNNDKLEFPDFTLEVFSGSHTKRLAETAQFTNPKAEKFHLDENGNFDPLLYDNFEYGTTDFLNYRITTKEGFTILIWGGQVGTDYRAYNYTGTEPDLMVYQLAAVNLGDGLYPGDRKNPNATILGDFIASVNPKMAIQNHQEKFTWTDLLDVNDQCAERGNINGSSTDFFTHKTHEWYRFSKDSSGSVSVTTVDH